MLDISLLHTVAATSLAINLAYLNLDKFRYRKKIKHVAQTAIDDCCEGVAELPDGFWKFTNFRAMARLSDSDEVNGSKNPEPGNIKKGYIKDFSLLYRIFLFHHQDRWTCGIICLLSILVIWLGTAQDVFTYKVAEIANSHSLFIFLDLFLSFGCFVPAIFVFVGARSIKWAEEYARTCSIEMSEFLKKPAKEAKFKPNS